MPKPIIVNKILCYWKEKEFVMKYTEMMILGKFIILKIMMKLIKN